MKKTTKAQKNMDIIAMLKGEKVEYGTTVEEAILHLERENELMKKKSTDKKPTARQLENEKLKPLILDFLSIQTEPKTVTEITKGIPELNDFSNQRVSYLVKDLRDSGMIERTVIKGRSCFSIKKD